MGAATTQHTPPYLKNSTPQTVPDKKTQAKAISYGGFFKSIFFFKFCFLRVCTCFTPGVERNGTRSSQSGCDPIVKSIQTCSSFLQGHGSISYGVATFGERNKTPGLMLFQFSISASLRRYFKLHIDVSSENGASHELYRNWVSPRRAQPPFLLSILQRSPNHPRRFAHNARLLPRTKAAVPVPDTPHLRADTPGLTSTRHVCVLEPSHGTVLTIVVVPSMLRFVTFKRNVCTSETDG